MNEHQDLQAVRALAKQANQLLDTHEVAPTPHNYEVFYTHAAGLAPGLSSELQKALEAESGFDATTIVSLYETHISDDGIARKLEEVGRGLGAIIREIRKVLGAAGDSAQTVQGALAAPGQGAENVPDTKALFDLVDTAARQLKSAAETLEETLERSEDQVMDLGRCLNLVQAELSVDPLTSINNRAYFDRQFERSVQAAAESGEPLSLLMLDVDHFKSFNDTHGHQTGDAVLKFVARLMQSTIKGQDTAARYGGEEFSVILPDTSLQQAILVAEKIRLAIGTRTIQRKSSGTPVGKVTVSIGVASLEMADTPATLLDRADRCLYHAKRSGRNTVKFSAPAPEHTSTNAA